ncbi:MAG: MlaD family protein [Planctomycetota bacterium]
MTERQASIAVGATTLVAAVGLLVLLVLFGFAPQWLKSGYAVTVTMPSGGGLSNGSRVTLSGIGIGEVELVRLAPDGNGVIIVARVRQSVRIPDGSRGEVSQSLFGVASDLVILPPEDAAERAALPTDGTAQIEGDVFTAAEQFSSSFSAAFASSTSAFDKLSEDFDQLTKEWTAVGRGLSNLIESPDDNPDAPSLAQVLAEAKATLSTVRSTVSHAETLVRDQQIRGDIRASIANARRVTTQAQALAKRYTALADDLSLSIKEANELLAAANRKEGTLGKLVQDPSLYENLDDATVRLQQLIDEARLLIEKWKKEGLPIQL